MQKVLILISLLSSFFIIGCSQKNPAPIEYHNSASKEFTTKALDTDEVKTRFENLESEIETIIVNQDDTLQKLAIEYKVSAKAIMLANNLKTEVIKEGQSITIPKVVYHHVKPGEDIWNIAEQYSVNYLGIAELNELLPPYNINNKVLEIIVSPKLEQFKSHRDVVKFNETLKIEVGEPQKQTKHSNLEILDNPRLEEHNIEVGQSINTLRSGSKHSIIKPTIGKITKSFGTGMGSIKGGILIAAPLNSKIISSTTGVVTSSGTKANYGKFIIIKSDDNIYTAYGYLNEITVSIGQKILQGETLGTSGIGPNGKPELYFAVKIGEKSVDPLPYFQD